MLKRKKEIEREKENEKRTEQKKGKEKANEEERNDNEDTTESHGLSDKPGQSKGPGRNQNKSLAGTRTDEDKNLQEILQEKLKLRVDSMTPEQQTRKKQTIDLIRNLSAPKGQLNLGDQFAERDASCR